jgi:PAS domain S-box-containing protein
VALRKEKILLGYLAIYRQEVRPFSEKEVALLQNFAEQAVIAMENARLLTETREALEQQTATAEVLGVINASPGNLEPVFWAILNRAHSICGAEMGSLQIWDGTHSRAVATLGYPEEIDTALRQPTAPGRGQLDLIAGTTTVFHRPDVTVEPPSDQTALEFRRLTGVRTNLLVPLRKDGACLGFITANRREARPFTDKEIALLESFAAQAVIAMENARLITETREALEQQTATAEVLGVINSSPGDLAPVFDALLEKALRLCESAFGILATYDGRVFRNAAFRGVPPELAEILRKRAPRPDPGLALYRVLQGDDVVQIADIADDDAYRNGIPGRRAMVDLGGARTQLLIALRRDKTLLGIFLIFRQEVRPFTEKQIALLQNFAAQAVIAMENARLITETREALEQQTATSEVLQVINSSPGNLAPVFDAMLEKAMRLCEAAFGLFFTYDGERLHSVAQRGVPPAYAEYRAHNPVPILSRPGTGIARALITRQPLNVMDLMATEAYASGDPVVRNMVSLGGVRSILSVPLCKDEMVIGLIAIYRQEVREFSVKQVALLENFAAQAVIAMENARLLIEQREALEQQTATAEVLQVINASPGNLTPVFDAMLEKALRLCEAACGHFRTSDGELLHLAAARGVPAPYAEFLRAPVRPAPTNPLGRLLRGDRVVVSVDAADEEPYRAGDPVRRAFVDLGGARSAVNVALVKDEKLLGTLTVYRQEVRPFTDQQIALLQNFAAQAVIAMENARLIDEQREALEQQTATAEVLQVINASPGNLQPVFEIILDKAMRLCGAAFGGLSTWDGKYAPIVAMRGYPPALTDKFATRGASADISPAIARLYKTKRPIQVPNVMEGEGYRNGHPDPRALADLGGARTFLAVPLCKDEIVLGHIAVYRQEVRVFSDKEIALLESFAAQAVIAMENARLLNEVRQRQEELRITFENMGDGVAMFDERPRLVAWNRKFQDILDLPDGVLAERLTFAEYIRYLTQRSEFGAGADPEEQLRRLTENVAQYRAFERVRPDGRVIEVRHNPVPAGGFVLIYADVTERKRSEAEIRAARDAAEEASRTIEAAYRDLKAAQANLIQAEKMASLGQLTAGIAHEIKNPLNFVNNFAELSGDLLDELHDAVATNQQGEIDELTATLKGNLAKIAEHGRRADGIVRSMLEHSRGSSGERRSADLNTLVDEALNLAYHGARAQDQSFNVTLERDFDEGVTPITLVPQDVTRVLLNLFSNGFYAARRRQSMEGATGFEPTLKVGTRELGDAIEIRVRDNGFGIPSEIRDKLFQPFFTTKPTGEGTGLGLSISYDIVTQQHGGSITVDSKVGEYSEFTIRLPRNS